MTYMTHMAHGTWPFITRLSCRIAFYHSYGDQKLPETGPHSNGAHTCYHQEASEKTEDISILSPEKKREIKEKAKEKQKQQESENQEAFLSVTKAGHSAKLKSTKETGTEAKSLIHEHVNNTTKKAHRCCVLRWEYDIACVWIFFLRFWDNVRNRGFSVLRIHY